MFESNYFPAPSAVSHLLYIVENVILIIIPVVLHHIGPRCSLNERQLHVACVICRCGVFRKINSFCDLEGYEGSVRQLLGKSQAFSASAFSWSRRYMSQKNQKGGCSAALVCVVLFVCAKVV